MSSATRFGASYEFGLGQFTANGLQVHSADIGHEAQVFSEADDGEGHPESVVASDPGSRMIVCRLRGYISDLSAYISSSATFELPASTGLNGKVFIVRSVSEPREKGEIVEGEMIGTHFPHVNIP